MRAEVTCFRFTRAFSQPSPSHTLALRYTERIDKSMGKYNPKKALVLVLAVTLTLTVGVGGHCGAT